MLFLLPVWLFTGTYFLPYAIWSYPLTINWFQDNGLVLYQDIIYHHTPLPLFVLYISSHIAGNTEMMLQGMSYILALACCYIMYFFARLHSRQAGKLLLVLVMTTFFPFASNFHIEEMVATICSLAAGFFFFQYRSTRHARFLVVCGMSIGAAFMSKQIAVGTIPAIGTILLFDGWSSGIRQSFNKIIYPSLMIGIGMVLSILPFALYFISRGALDDFWYWNIVYNIAVYPQAYASYVSGTEWKEGIFNFIWILVPVSASLYVLMKNKRSDKTTYLLLFLLVSTISFLPAILPGFHLYKFLSVYPYPIIALAILFATVTNIQRIMIGFLTVVLAYNPVNAFYVDFFIPHFPSTEIIREYGTDEEQTISWLQTHLPPKEKIMNMGHHYITTRSGMLPHNKYITPFPWLLVPFDETANEIIAHPPRIVVIDTRQTEQFPVLKTWKFIGFVTQRYSKIETFGNIELWVHPDYEIPET